MLWLGETDPIWTQESVAAADSVRGDLGAVIEAIRKHPQLGDDEPFSAKQPASCAIAPGDLQTALTAALPNGKVTTKAVSSFLNRNRGRIIEGWCIEAFTDSMAEALRFRVRKARNVEEAGSVQAQMPF